MALTFSTLICSPSYSLLTLLLLFLCPPVHSSTGDQSPVFLSCIHRCFFANCTHYADVITFLEEQPWYLKFTFWDCEDECCHNCMWEAVDFFEGNDQRVQFRGKWPFIRWYGVQEPASALFSIFNAIAHIYGWTEFKKRVSADHKFYSIWRFQALLAMNAWFWSTVFHTRDIEFTEKMDYFSAYSIVLYSLYALCARVFYDRLQGHLYPLQALFIALFSYHVYRMENSFDYTYHMAINICTGVLNSAGWLWWCRKNLPHRAYVNKCIIVVVALLLLSSLEIADFPPFWFIFDAHSLWHLGTATLPFIWYRFLIDDCLYEDAVSHLRKQQKNSNNNRVQKQQSANKNPTCCSKSMFETRNVRQFKEILKEISIFQRSPEDEILL